MHILCLPISIEFILELQFDIHVVIPENQVNENLSLVSSSKTCGQIRLMLSVFLEINLSIPTLQCFGAVIHVVVLAVGHPTHCAC